MRPDTTVQLNVQHSQTLNPFAAVLRQLLAANVRVLSELLFPPCALSPPDTHIASSTAFS
jgi:hypothetical protein